MLATPQLPSGSEAEQQQGPRNVHIYTFSSGSSGFFEALGVGTGSSWYHDSYEDDAAVITVDDLAAQLVDSRDPGTTLTVLQQLVNPAVALHGCVINCEAWQPLLQLLPVLLSSPCRKTAAAAEQLLLVQLAPELLDCSPEPLAQVLVALLTAATPACCQARAANVDRTAAANAVCSRAAHALQQDSRSQVEKLATASAGVANSTASTCGLQHCIWSDVVVQVVLIGLHKLARQWHFLAVDLGQQLCTAVADMLLQPLLMQGRQLQQRHEEQGCVQAAVQQHQQQGVPQDGDHKMERQQEGLPQHQQQPEQQQQVCCIAEQLLLTDPSMGWWHRLNASSKSSKQIKAATISSGLLQQLLVYAVSNTRLQLPQASGKLQPYRNVTSQGSGCSCAAVAPVATAGQDVHRDAPETVTSSHVCSRSSGELVSCLVAQLLAALVMSPSGRQLVAAQDQRQQIASVVGEGGEIGARTSSAVDAAVAYVFEFDVAVDDGSAVVHCPVLSAASAAARHLRQLW